MECPKCGEPAPTLKHLKIIDGRWVILHVLGKGGMGTVYRARDSKTSQEVALKLLSAELLLDEEVMTRFEREARLMQKMEHPHLVRVLHVGTHDKLPYFVMQYVEGSTLSTLLTEKHRFSLAEAVPILKQVGAVLTYVHQQSIVHRDVKPANILIAQKGEVTLLDFGVAKERSSATTRTGALIGTPRYMAPELILGQKVDFRADIYSLALVAYEMLTGSHPFAADADVVVMMAQINTPVPDPRTRVPGLPPYVAESLMHGLTKEPTDRFSSAEAFIQSLEKAPSEARTVLVGALLTAETATLPPGSHHASSAQTVVMAALEQQTVVPQLLTTDSGRVYTGEARTVVDHPSPYADAAATVVGDGSGRHSSTSLFDTPVPTVTDGHIPTFVARSPRPYSRSSIVMWVAGVVLLAALAGFAAWLFLPTEEHVPVAEAQRQPTPMAPAPSTTHGELLVQVTLGGKPVVAVLEVDGVRRGQTLGPVKLEPGARQVKVLYNRLSTSRKVEITAGRLTQVKMELQ